MSSTTGTDANARSLAGWTVVVTRPRARARRLLELLDARGARALVLPAIATVPLAGEEADPLRRAAAALPEGGYDWVVLTSVAAVDALAGALPPGTPLAAALRGVRTAAVGEATAARLVAAGVAEPLTGGSTGEALARAAVAAGARDGARVLVPRAEQAREQTRAVLRAAGARVDDPVAYRTAEAVGERDAAAARALISDQGGAARVVLTFASPSAARAFAAALDGPARARLADGGGAAAGAPRPRPRVASIGPTTSAALRALGWPVDAEAASPGAEPLVEAIAAARAGWEV